MQLGIFYPVAVPDYSFKIGLILQEAVIRLKKFNCVWNPPHVAASVL